MATKEAEKQERERQWRIAKGLEAPGQHWTHEWVYLMGCKAEGSTGKCMAYMLLMCAGRPPIGSVATFGAPIQRESWMTELPPERVAPGRSEQVGCRFRSWS